MPVPAVPAALPWVAPSGPIFPSGLTVTIGGVPVVVVAGSFNIFDAIGQRSTCNFIVRDDIGASKYRANQPVTAIDGNGVLIFAGFIDRARREKPGATSLLYHTIKCKDMHWLADKRTVATSYTNQTCGFMVQDIVNNWLAAEGVTVGVIQAGPIVTPEVVNYKTAAVEIDNLRSEEHTSELQS